MNRPQVQIESENKIAALRRHLEKMLPEFKALPGVVGLTLNGGLSRGYADHLSEIDVTIYLTSEAFGDWQSGKPPIAVGITRLAGQLYDIKYVDFNAERVRDWDDTELWDASGCERESSGGVVQGRGEYVSPSLYGERPGEGYWLSTAL